MKNNKIEEITLSTANEFAVKLVLELSQQYSISLEKVFDIFTETNYWRVINDTEVCCELAHDGLQATIKDIAVWFNAIPDANITPDRNRKEAVKNLVSMRK